jgi:hypothetical protein
LKYEKKEKELYIMKKNFLIGLLVLLPLILGALIGLFNKQVGALMFLYFGLAFIIVTLITLLINIKNL